MTLTKEPRDQFTLAPGCNRVRRMVIGGPKIRKHLVAASRCEDHPRKAHSRQVLTLPWALTHEFLTSTGGYYCTSGGWWMELKHVKADRIKIHMLSYQWMNLDCSCFKTKELGICSHASTVVCDFEINLLKPSVNLTSWFHLGQWEPPTHPTEMMGLNFLSSAKMVWGYFGLRRQHLAWAREYTIILEPSMCLQVLTKTGSHVNMFQELWVSRLGGQDHPDSTWAVWPSLGLPRTSNVIDRSWP